MSAEPARRHLRPVDTPEDAEAVLLVVNPTTGESTPYLEYTQNLHDQMAGLETDVRSWRTRHANLKRDKEAEARKDAKWPDALAIFDYWRRVCRHPRASFDAATFEQVRPYLERHGVELCKLACDGAAFDPMEKRAKNGRMLRFDEFDLIFRNEVKFRSFCNRAPVERQREVMAAAGEQATLDQPQPAQ